MEKKVAELLAGLHPLERKVLPFLADGILIEEVQHQSGMKDVEVMRAVQWLGNKGLVRIEEKRHELVSLDENGRLYLKQGLPERQFLHQIRDQAKTLKEMKQHTTLSDEEMAVSIGILKKKGLIEIKRDEKRQDNLFFITDQGKRSLERQSLEELFLNKEFPLDQHTLSDEERYALASLQQRKKIVKRDMRKEKQLFFTGQGKALCQQLIMKLKAGEQDLSIERLTSQIIRSEAWKNKKFRPYDVKINVPKIVGGKKQPYAAFIEGVRDKLLGMGFAEMEGPLIELEFYNFDALFQPQNHPARDWSSTYRIKEPRYGLLPDKKIVQNVKQAHEKGIAGSTGWRYRWDEKAASQLMPRAHDTAISPRYLARKDLKIPGKYFSLVRCFRPDVIDATHGVEFNQLGGFIVDEGLSFPHLLGLLKQFAVEITGVKEVRFYPDYFPFTEPSVQLSIKHPSLGWMELAGAGVFRPELTCALGVKEQVIAWGFGIDRLAMVKLGIKDIRDLFSQDLQYLRAGKKE
ncbi:MAG: phenylalanine--tRNA ligase subunit alpha [Nanoarchaeota archaeon]